jgi:rubrerythrin
MAPFVDPFPGVIPDRLTKEGMSKSELVRALRQDLAAEEEAVHLYESHIDASRNPLVNAALQEIANDEKVHAGKFLRLIEMLTGDEGEYLLQGADEADKTYQALSKVRSDVMKLVHPILPMPPGDGPPLPRALCIQWPSKE